MSVLVARLLSVRALWFWGVFSGCALAHLVGWLWEEGEGLWAGKKSERS